MGSPSLPGWDRQPGPLSEAAIGQKEHMGELLSSMVATKGKAQNTSPGPSGQQGSSIPPFPPSTSSRHLCPFCQRKKWGGS